MDPFPSSPRRSSEDIDAKARLDAATKAACDLNKILKHLSNYSQMKSYLPPDTIAWIEAHEEADHQREAAELAKVTKKLIRQGALNKLTPEEKAALGIKYER